MKTADSQQNSSGNLDTDPNHYSVVIACGHDETEEMIRERIKESPSLWAIVIDTKRNTIGLGGIAHKDIQWHELMLVERKNYFAGIVELDPARKEAKITLLLDRRDPKGIVEDKRTGEKHETGIPVGEEAKFEAFKDAVTKAIQFQLLQRL